MTEIISRARWGARFRDGFGARPLSGVSEIWLHHSVTAAAGEGASFEADAATIRTIESIGQNRFGGGISYTYLITPSGRVFEGHSVGRVGAHTGGRNTRAIGICLVGNYENQSMTAAQEAALVWLLKTIKANRWATRGTLNGGHRDVKSTSCPGRHAYARIGAINAAASSSGAPAPSQPTQTGGGSTYTVKSGDTLSGIGAKTGVRWQTIASLNGIGAPYTIHPGQVLKLTGAAAPAPKPAPKPAPPATSVLRSGSSGAKVGRLQSGLRSKFPAYRNSVSVKRGQLISVDNSFGPQTDAWVREFQRRTGLKVDGIVGPATTAKLAQHGITL